MQRHQGLLFLLTLLFSWPTTAALPPLYQNLKEIRTLLEHPALEKNFGPAGQIEAILRTPAGYTLKSADCELEMALTYLPNTGPGPLRFELSQKRFHCEQRTP